MTVPDEGQLMLLHSQGDEPVDAIVRAMEARHGAAALAALLDMLMRWDPLETLCGPYPALPPGLMAEADAFLRVRGFLDDAMPEGVDWPRVRRAQSFYWKHKSLGLLILGCGSLPACYANPGIAQVLMGSGRLSLQVSARLAETIGFLTTVMKPDSLGAGVKADGTQFEGNLWIRKVRLMHSIMRCLMLAHPSEFNHLSQDTAAGFLGKLDYKKDAAQDDCPIDQVELALVLLSFSWIVIRGLRIMWVLLGTKRAEDHLYAWSVIGHGLGIVPELRPVRLGEAKTLFKRICAKYEAGTQAGRLLVAALVVYIITRLRQGVREMLPRWVPNVVIVFCRTYGSSCLESLARTYVRVLTGEKTADKLWVARAPLLHWLGGLLVRLAILARDHIKRDVEGDKGLTGHLGRQFQAGLPHR